MRVQKGNRNFRRAIIEARQALGLSQTDAAYVIGVCPNAVFEWEAGYVAPRLRSVLKIADAYGISRHHLIELLTDGVDGMVANQSNGNQGEPK